MGMIARSDTLSDTVLLQLLATTMYPPTSSSPNNFDDQRTQAQAQSGSTRRQTRTSSAAPTLQQWPSAKIATAIPHYSFSRHTSSAASNSCSAQCQTRLRLAMLTRSALVPKASRPKGG